MKNVFSISISDDFDNIEFKKNEDGDLAIACLSKVLVEDEDFRKSLDTALRFILESLGEEEQLRSIKELLEELNIKLDD